MTCEKALIQIDLKLPNLLVRFRDVLINYMIQNKELTFEEIVENLRQKSNSQPWPPQKPTSP